MGKQAFLRSPHVKATGKDDAVTYHFLLMVPGDSIDLDQGYRLADLCSATLSLCKRSLLWNPHITGAGTGLSPAIPLPHEARSP